VDDATLLARMHANERGFYRLMAKASPGARALELDGVLAAVIPATPDRSVFNSVFYDSAEALAASLDRLAEAYDEAGVRAWTVWVHESDDEAPTVLERAGHTLDAQPRAMAFELAGFERRDNDGLDSIDRGDLADAARINDGAYPFPERPFSAGLATLSDDAARVYLARADGKAVSCLGTFDLDGDCGIYFVATLPEFRGRGLAGGLLARALADARERGCETTSLQATAVGASVYARVGYRDLGALGMWERRKA
jgi:GNAT superfamily N-acetyltransferase